MHRNFQILPWLVLALIAVPANAAPPDLVATTEARTPAEELKAFHLPEGFVAELVAAEPEIHKPLNLGFDDRGRLWVTETLEYPFPAPEGQTPRDGVKILSDFGPDGRARKVSTFATGLNIPIGLLPMPGGNSALVHSIPEIYRLTDTDGDGRADRKEPAYGTFGARDTHGMTNAFSWGFDGWIYACHGFSNESQVKGSDGRPIVMQSGNTYRMSSDGSRVEYFTHGQVNPFGLAFDPLGNLYSSDCHSRPIYQLLRGAWYPSFGKPDDGLGFGPGMCPHDHGSTGIAGIVFYAADHFPKAYQDRIFIGNPVTSRINQDTVSWKGSSPTAIEQPDFLVSDDPWFRPVDLELGPDGALYVADFYNRIIGHYEVPLTHPGRDRERGRIWRIVYKGKEAHRGLETPSGISNGKRDFDAWVELLKHPNIAVRTFATNALASEPPRDADAIARLAATDEDVNRRVHALWILQRWGELDQARGEATLVHALGDPDRTARTHAQRVLAERPVLNERQTGLMRQGLTDSDAFVRRAAADAIGRHPNIENVKPLLALRANTDAGDTHLLHVVRMALRDQLSDDAWDRLGGLGLSDDQLAMVADVAPGVHSAGSARFLMKYLAAHEVPREALTRYVGHVSRYGGADAESKLVEWLGALSRNEDQAARLGGLLGQVELLKAYQQGLETRGARLSDAAKAQAGTLASSLLDSAKREEFAAGIDLAGAYHLTETAGKLKELASDARKPERTRGEALAALQAVNAGEAQPLLAEMVSAASAPIGLRERAAGLLASSGRNEATASLLAALPAAPARLQSAIAAGLATRRASAEGLLDAVAAGKASARLLQEPRVAGALGNAGVPELAPRLEKLLSGLPPADARINALIATRRAGFGMAKADPEPGAKIFETQCANCHMLGGKGGRVGPQLDGIGVRGPDRLLEDLLDPNRNVDQTFRLTTLALKNGQVVSGLLLREEGEVVVLADAQGKEVRVSKPEIEERSVAPVSPMPANLSEQIPEEDFYRLLAYLLTHRPAN